MIGASATRTPSTHHKKLGLMLQANLRVVFKRGMFIFIGLSSCSFARKHALLTQSLSAYRGYAKIAAP